MLERSHLPFLSLPWFLARCNISLWMHHLDESRLTATMQLELPIFVPFSSEIFHILPMCTGPLDHALELLCTILIFFAPLRLNNPTPRILCWTIPNPTTLLQTYAALTLKL